MSDNDVEPVPEGDLDWPVAAVPDDGVTELRVHGVGGTPPEGMLGDPHPTQVTGDRIAGMWRAASPGPDWHREAYAWGGLTSRALSSALWLVLLPFALLNLAGWTALDRAGGPTWRIGFQQSLIRVIGLLATWTYILFTALIAMDFGAWQCTRPETTCHLDFAWKWLRLDGDPAQASAVAAIVPLLVIGLLALVSAESKKRYELYRPRLDQPAGTAGRPTLPLRTVRLTDARLWHGGGYADHTRTLHIASSLLVVALLLLAVARQGGHLSGLALAGIFVTAGLLGLGLLAAGVEPVRRLLFPAWWPPVATAAAVLAGAVVLAWLQPAPELSKPDLMPGMAILSNVFIVGAYTLALLLGAVSWIGWWRAGSTNWVGRTVLPAPFLAVAMAVFLLFAVWAGVAVWVARALSPDAVARGPDVDAEDLVYPGAFETLTVWGLLGLLGVLLVVGAVAVVSYRKVRNRCRDDLGWELAVWQPHQVDAGRRASVAGPDRQPSGWLRRARSSQWFAGAARWLEGTLVGVVGAGSVVAVSYTAVYAARWVGWGGVAWLVVGLVALGVGLTLLVRGVAERGRLFLGLVGFAAGLAVAVWAGWWLSRFADEPAPAAPPPPQIWNLPMAGIATTVLTLVPIAAVLLLRQAITSPGFRRTVGVAWDVATFWPRAFHPLAPPSYAERAVPELTTRVCRLLTRDRAVILAGHSQGAVLTVAAVAQLASDAPDHRLPLCDGLTPAHLSRLSVITYGNPVVNLYQRFFPHYFDRDTIDAVTALPGKWVNFFRYTDPVGRELFRSFRRSGSAPPPTSPPEMQGDCWLPDPPTDLHRPGDVEPRVRTHGHDGYLRQSTFAGHLRAEAQRLVRLVQR